MTAEAPTILATSGGAIPGRRTRFELGPLTEFALDLAGSNGRAPKVCFLASALGDNPMVIQAFYEAALLRGLRPSHLTTFPMPNVDDPAAHLLDQDVVWVWGGSVAGLLAMWRLHGYDDMMRAAWQAGVVMTGVSAGSLCWHIGGTTDSFGPDLQPVTNGLGFIPLSNGVHYDSEDQRRPLYHSLVADRTLPAGYATDDGVGLLYRGTTFIEAVSEQDDKGAYYVERGDEGLAVETRVDTRRL